MTNLLHITYEEMSLVKQNWIIILNINLNHTGEVRSVSRTSWCNILFTCSLSLCFPLKCDLTSEDINIYILKKLFFFKRKNNNNCYFSVATRQLLFSDYFLFVMILISLLSLPCCQDLHGAIKRVSSFLQCPLVEDEVNKCVKYCGFSSMKDNKMVNYTLISEEIMDHSKGSFMRKGGTLFCCSAWSVLVVFVWKRMILLSKTNFQNWNCNVDCSLLSPTWDHNLPRGTKTNMNGQRKIIKCLLVKCETLMSLGH